MNILSASGSPCRRRRRTVRLVDAERDRSRANGAKPAPMMRGLAQLPMSAGSSRTNWVRQGSLAVLGHAAPGCWSRDRRRAVGLARRTTSSRRVWMRRNGFGTAGPPCLRREGRPCRPDARPFLASRPTITAGRRCRNRPPSRRRARPAAGDVDRRQQRAGGDGGPECRRQRRIGLLRQGGRHLAKFTAISPWPAPPAPKRTVDETTAVAHAVRQSAERSLPKEEDVTSDQGW